MVKIECMKDMQVVKEGWFSFSTLLLIGLTVLMGAVYVFIPLFSAGLVIAIIAGILFLLRLLNRAAENFPDPLAKWVHCIHATVFECFSFVLVLCFIPLRLKNGRKTGQGRPILLVHGYLNNNFVWVLHKYYLEKAGLGPIYTITLKNPITSIRAYANQVQIKADEIAKKTGRDDLILVGHSMGGLVSALYACTLAPKGKVTDVITISSPFKGTPVAYIGLGRNAREMWPNSELSKEIRTAISQNTQIRFYHTAVVWDELVVPGTSALLGDRADRQMVLEDIAHISTLFSRRITRKIYDWIKKTH